MMRTPWGLHKTLKGLSWLLSRLCKVHEESMRSPRGLVESMRSPWERVGYCKIQNKAMVMYIDLISYYQAWSWLLAAITGRWSSWMSAFCNTWLPETLLEPWERDCKTHVAYPSASSLECWWQQRGHAKTWLRLPEVFGYVSKTWSLLWNWCVVHFVHVILVWWKTTAFNLIHPFTRCA